MRVLLTAPFGDVHLDLDAVAHVQITTDNTEPVLSIVERGGFGFFAADTPANRAALAPVLANFPARTTAHKAFTEHEHEWSAVIKNGLRACRVKGCDASLAVPTQ